MNIIISAKHMETGEALKTHVEEHLKNSVSKYFENAIDATVVFSKNNHMFKCNITVDEGVKDGIAITADDEENEVYEAFNKALAKAEKQLRRYKRKLKDRSNKKGLAELNAEAS